MATTNTISEITFYVPAEMQEALEFEREHRDWQKTETLLTVTYRREDKMEVTVE